MTEVTSAFVLAWSRAPKLGRERERGERAKKNKEHCGVRVSPSVRPSVRATKHLWGNFTDSAAAGARRSGLLPSGGGNQGGNSIG